MKSGQACLRVKRTRRGSTTATFATLLLRRAPRARRGAAALVRGGALAPRYRSKENLTSSAVITSPLWKRTFLRSTNSYTSPSFDCVHDSASDGVIGLPGPGFTRASCRAESAVNGGMMPAVSAGSNQVGASEMCTAQVAWPSAPAAGHAVTPASRADAMARGADERGGGFHEGRGGFGGQSDERAAEGPPEGPSGIFRRSRVTTVSS